AGRAQSLVLGNRRYRGRCHCRKQLGDGLDGLQVIARGVAGRDHAARRPSRRRPASAAEPYRFLKDAIGPRSRRDRARTPCPTMPVAPKSGTFIARSASKARLNHSAVHPEGGTVGRGGERAAHVSDQIGHLFGHREPLQERRRTKVVKNSFSNSANDLPPLSCPANSSTPEERVGPGNTAFTVTAVPAHDWARPRDTASCAVFVMP